jgi:hypothetical protein
MITKELVGRRVRVIAGEPLGFRTDDLRRTQRRDRPEGTVTHVEAFGDGDDDGDVWLRIDGLPWEYVFGRYQLEVVPSAEGGKP